MSKYFIRLDDASEYMDVEKWRQMEALLDKYGIKPIFGIIPYNDDPNMVGIYPQDTSFWDRAKQWCAKGWKPALHGYSHVFCTEDGGLNPVNNRSEFAGLPFEEQRRKIKDGYELLLQHGITPKIFFAPAHTFDSNTLRALEEKTKIRIISDTVANDVYYTDPFYFIPQQSGRVRKLPFKTVTFCYHPNTMSDPDFKVLEDFIRTNKDSFPGELPIHRRQRSFLDEVLKALYFARRKK